MCQSICLSVQILCNDIIYIMAIFYCLPAAVKHAGDSIVGVQTQCIVARTLEKKDTSTLTNVCLKINAKLGGTNSTLSK